MPPAAPGSPTTMPRPPPAGQLYLFGSAEGAVLDELRMAEPDRLTPIEALNLLSRLRGLLDPAKPRLFPGIPVFEKT